MITRTLLAIGVLMLALGVSAQTADAYLQLIRFYRTDPAAAIVSMARMSESAIAAAQRRCAPTDPTADPGCREADMFAGAMLHLDTAEQLLAPNSEPALVHIRAGQQLLQVPPYLLRGSKLIGGTKLPLARVVFARRWHELAARLLVAHGHGVAANAIVTEGRTRYQDAAEFFVALGVITEWRAGVAGVGWLSADLRGAAINDTLFDDPYSLFGSTSPQRLESATKDYLRALAIDPVHPGARLRLAWVHLLTGDRRVWEDLSTEFLKTVNAETRLIARLIRGTAAEREKRADRALAEYLDARLAAPGSQPACIAVSRAKALAGDFAGAEVTAAECLTLAHDPDSVDPWTLFLMGLMDTTTTRWLHDEARRP